ncbi:MAG: anaerobic C4-dicarboxylate transporter [Planctomycetes bacterium]|nr:anaerobic C4-dicarboxylate transporter [Planctomycetota bacterium]
MIWAQFAVVLAVIFLGARIGGVGLGTMAGIGLAVLVFGFGLPPAGPPGEVLAIILAVVIAAATMQAAGGMDLLVTVAERLLRARPRQITFVGPLVSYAFTFCAGTGHVAYSILPVIAEVSRKAGIRPERPLSISVIASQAAITASPLSAATAAMVALLSAYGIELGTILLVCVPSTLLGVLAGALSVYRRGPELDQDPDYAARLAAGLVDPPAPMPKLEGRARRNAIGAVSLFLLAAGLIVMFGMLPQLRPTFPVSQDPDAQSRALGMPQIIQFMMYSASGLMMLFCGAKPDATIRSPVGVAGMVAVISVLGLGWLGSCFYQGNQQQIVDGLSEVVQAAPWVFAVALFGLSVLLFSQASTVAALMPVGLALGIAPKMLVAYFPAVNGYFFLPTYATLVAAVAFDRTGTTKLGRFVVDHSFMRPGLVATGVALVTGSLLARTIA